VAERPIALRPDFWVSAVAQENALSYRVSRNGSAGDWYWEVISDRKIIHRGLAPTRAQARTQALKVAASHAVRQPEDSTPPFEGLKVIERP
jgi:hypothetical protein